MIAIYLTDTVTRLRAAARDKYGEPTSADAETDLPAQVEMTVKVVRDFKGVLTPASARLLLQDAPLPTDKYRIDGTVRGALAINTVRDFSSRFYEVFVE